MNNLGDNTKKVANILVGARWRVYTVLAVGILGVLGVVFPRTAEATQFIINQICTYTGVCING